MSAAIPSALPPGDQQTIELRPRSKSDLGPRLRAALRAGAAVRITLTRRVGRFDLISFIDGVAVACDATVERIGSNVIEVRPTLVSHVQVPTKPLDTFVDTAMGYFATAVRTLPAAQSALLTTISGSPEALADRLIASLPLSGIWDEHVGPFYDFNGVAAVLGVGVEFVEKLTEGRDVLSLETGIGETLFPAFQFEPDRRPAPHLRSVLVALDPEQLDDWGSALWLNTPASALGDDTPAQALGCGRHDAVLQLARRIGASWNE